MIPRIFLNCATCAAFARASPVSAFAASCSRISRFLAQSSPKTLSHARMSTDHPLQTEPASKDVIWPSDPAVRIVLGSQSATRRQILKEMRVDFEAISPNINEKALRCDSPEKLVLALAHAKATALLQDRRVADAVADQVTVLLTCDQVVVHDGKILEKPESKQQAAQFMRGYGATPCSTVGATVVTNLRTGRRYEAVDIAKIHFRSNIAVLVSSNPGIKFSTLVDSQQMKLNHGNADEPLSEHVIEALLEEGSVMSCAGGLMVEAAAVQPFLTRIEGSMDAVMGLSKRTVARLLQAALA